MQRSKRVQQVAEKLPQPTEEVTRLLNNHGYTPNKLLGSGGYGKVYLATNKTKSSVAIKVILKSSDNRADIMNEIDIFVQISRTLSRKIFMFY